MGYAIESIRNGGKQTGVVNVAMASGINQSKAASAIGSFNTALCNAALANHGSLLIASHAADV